MALPKLNTINYEMDLPSNGEKIKYRPFLVKEQKNLLIAQETEDPKIIESALADIIKECTFGSIDPYKTPLFDIEYIFLKIRGKSVGEKVILNLLCPDDGKTRVETEIDLSEVNVQMNVEHTNTVKITDSISLVMRYPTLSSMNDFSDDGQITSIFNLIKKCVHEVRDGDEIHHRIDISETELDEFVDSMSTKNFEDISSFFETMPKIMHIVDVVNPKTKKKNEVVIEGIQSFFE